MRLLFPLLFALSLAPACSPVLEVTTPEAEAFDPGVDFAGGVLVETLAADRTLTKQDPLIVKLDANGSSRNVTLPAAHTGGLKYVVNSSTTAVNLVVKNAAGSTIVTVNQNEAAWVACDSASGAWVLVNVVTIALS